MPPTTTVDNFTESNNIGTALLVLPTLSLQLLLKTLATTVTANNMYIFCVSHGLKMMRPYNVFERRNS